MWSNGAPGRMAHLVHQRANARDARVIVRLAKIDRAADLRVHLARRPVLPREVFCPIAACTSAGPARKSPLPSVIRM